MSLLSDSTDYINYLEVWQDNLPNLDLLSLDIKKTVLISVDMINGFAKFGPLSSPRVGALIHPINDLATIVSKKGGKVYLMQDSHGSTDREFEFYPVHCVSNTPEAETVDEFKNAVWYKKATKFLKRTLGPNFAHKTPRGNTFEQTLNSFSSVENIIIVGDCTDLCINAMVEYLTAYWGERAYYRQKPNIIISTSLVDTYDLPLGTAVSIGIEPHPGNLNQVLFLHKFSCNGVTVVKNIIF